MSIRYMTWAWGLPLQPLPKLVLLKLADNANDQGQCFPSVSLVATHCSISTRTVQRTINELRLQRMLKIEKRFRRDGSQTSNMYTLLMRELPGVKLSPPRGDRQVEGVSQLSPQPAKNDTQTKNQTSNKETPQTCGRKLVWPEKLTNEQETASLNVLQGLDAAVAQCVLDELAGRMRQSQIKNPVRYLTKLVVNARAGTFTPVMTLRETQRRANDVIADGEQINASKNLHSKKAVEESIDQLPPGIKNSLLSIRARLSNTDKTTKS